MVNINLKWGKESYELDVDADENSDTLRAQIYSLTAVPVDKQKIMGFKGGLLKSGVKLSDVGLSEGLKVTLIGTAEEKQLQAPKTEIIFQEQVVGDKRPMLDIGIIKPVGLTNLGNTCYMNSVVQSLRPAYGLQQKLKNINATKGLVPYTFKNLNQELKSSDDKVVPQAFVLAFKNTHTQFSNFQQQDAEEFLSTLLNDLGGAVASPSATAEDALSEEFGFTVEHRYECIEDSSLAPEINVDTTRKLSVFCGTPTVPVNHLHEGLRLSLEESISKMHPSLNRNAVFKKVTRMSSIPKFLHVQLVRFEWKQAHVLAGTEATKAKICRKITFPVKLDLWEFLSSALKRKLSLVREILTDRTERAIAASLVDAAAVVENKGSAENDVEMKEGEKKEEKPEEVAPAAAVVSAVEEEEEVDEFQGIIAGEPVETGTFDICSVVTHSGLSADSGHYIGFVRKACLEKPADDSLMEKTGGAAVVDVDKETSVEDKWVRFDDDRCTEMSFKETAIEGGHQHSNTAYIIMYRRRVLVPTKKELGRLKKAYALKMAAEAGAQTESADKSGVAL